MAPKHHPNHIPLDTQSRSKILSDSVPPSGDILTPHPVGAGNSQGETGTFQSAEYLGEHVASHLWSLREKMTFDFISHVRVCCTSGV